MKKLLLLISCAPSLFLTANGFGSEAAKVNGVVITQEELNRKHQESLKFFQTKPPTKKSVLDDIIKRQLAIQEAKKLGLDREAEIRDRMDNVLYQALIERKLAKEFEQIQISDDEARSYYSENPEIRTSHIFISLRPDAPSAEIKKAREKIEKAAAALKEGKMSFAEVAQRFSEGPAASMGGDIDYQTRDRLDPTYYQTARDLKSPGKVSGIVRTQFGFHVIRLTAVRPWEEVDKAQVKRQVFEQKRGELFNRYMSQLQKSAKITIQSEALKE